MEQQARNMCIQFQERDEKPNYLIHDRDAKFTGHFREIFNAEGLYVQRLPKGEIVAERRLSHLDLPPAG